MTSPIHDPIPGAEGAQREAVCCTCGLRFVQRFLSMPANEPPAGWYPDFCMREKCSAVEELLESAAAEVQRQRSELAHVVTRIDAWAHHLAAGFARGMPDALTKPARVSLQAWVDELKARSSLNRGGPRA